MIICHKHERYRRSLYYVLRMVMVAGCIMLWGCLTASGSDALHTVDEIMKNLRVLQHNLNPAKCVLPVNNLFVFFTGE